MIDREYYMRRGTIAFRICLRQWTVDDGAPEKAAEYLIAFVNDLPPREVQRLHDALWHSRERAHFEETPDDYAQALIHLKRHEAFAWDHATKDWMIRPNFGHLVYLSAAGDAGRAP